MPPAYRLIEIDDAAGKILEADWLARSETVHRHLRPHLADYPATMREVLALGAQMTIAADGDAVVAVAVYRIIVNTAYGRCLYVDDLVTDPDRRSQGAGKALLDWCGSRAEERGCAWLTLDSGTHRTAAHRFYFRERMHVSSFHFVRKL